MIVQPIHAAEMGNDSWKSSVNGTQFQINQTLWGYVLLSEYSEKPQRTMFTIARQTVGVILVLAALSLWVFSSLGADSDIVGFKLGLTALYGMLAFLFLYRPSQLMRREVQVDVNRAQLRAGFRNDTDDFHLESVHAFDAISVVSLCAGKTSDEDAGLLLRIGDSDIALVAAHGPRDAIEQCRVNLAMDLGAPTGKFNPVALATSETRSPMVLGPRIGADVIAA